MKRIFFIFLLVVICILNNTLSETNMATEWTEADFAFYDSNLEISEKPTAGGSWSSSHISLEEKEDGQTYRGIRVGNPPELLLQKYDFSDAEWRIYDTKARKDAMHGISDRSESLTTQWKAEGKTGTEVLAMADFLCSKGYYFYIEIDIYRYNGQFVTKSQIDLDYDVVKEEIRNQEIESMLNQYPDKYTREKMEQLYDEYVAKQEDNYYDYYIQEYIQQFCRAKYEFCIEDGIITQIELSDYYYQNLKYAYNDDGTLNSKYAYILNLK